MEIASIFKQSALITVIQIFKIYFSTQSSQLNS